MSLAALAALVWLNVPFPMTPEVLKGKVVAVVTAEDSTQAGRRALRDAMRLEARFPKGFAVLGLWPGTVEAARSGVLLRELDFPVAAGAPAGPISTVLYDASGREVERWDGVPVDAVAARAAGLIDGAKKMQVLDESPLPLKLERDAAPAASPLSLPAGLSYDASSKSLYVADGGAHALLVLSPEGKLKAVAGSGARGSRDGRFQEAAFDRPYGVAFGAGAVYVSDEGNETVRRLDFEKRQVKTIMTGRGLFGPLGLLFHDGMLLAAETAGFQISSAQFPGGRRSRLVGTGEPGTADGSLAKASFREPAALAEAGGKIWVADGPVLRLVDLANTAVSTPKLKGEALVRPAALAGDGDAVLIADAGDGSLKRMSADGTVTVLASGLSHPSGVAVVGPAIVVSDTGRRRLLRYAKDGKPLGELKVTGLLNLKGPPMGYLPERADVEPPEISIAESGEIVLEVSVDLPKDHILTPRAPFAYRVSETRGRISVVESTRKGFLMENKTPVRLRFTPNESITEALLEVDFHYCRKDGTGPSKSASKRYRLVFRKAAAGPKTVTFSAAP